MLPFPDGNKQPHAIPAHSTFPATNPTVSSELAYPTTPYRDHVPYDGLKPTVDVQEEGRRREPPVSVLMERREDPWVVVAAALEEDPPGDRMGGGAGCITGVVVVVVVGVATYPIFHFLQQFCQRAFVIYPMWISRS